MSSSDLRDHIEILNLELITLIYIRESDKNSISISKLWDSIYYMTKKGGPKVITKKLMEVLLKISYEKFEYVVSNDLVKIMEIAFIQNYTGLITKIIKSDAIKYQHQRVIDQLSYLALTYKNVQIVEYLLKLYGKIDYGDDLHDLNNYSDSRLDYSGHGAPVMIKDRWGARVERANIYDSLKEFLKKHKPQSSRSQKSISLSPLSNRSSSNRSSSNRSSSSNRKTKRSS